MDNGLAELGVCFTLLVVCVLGFMIGVSLWND